MLKGNSKGRHVIMDAGALADYALVRAAPLGPVANEAAIDQLLRTNACDERRFYVFRHVDATHTQRNALVPVYEACYYCSDGAHFVKAQKCHLKQAYMNAGRTDTKRANDMMENNDGTPYWVDRHAHKANLRKRQKKKK